MNTSRSWTTCLSDDANLVFSAAPVPSSCLQSEEVPSPQPAPTPQPPPPTTPPAPQPTPATSQYNLTQEQLIRQQLLAKQKQLLELQQKKIELELEQTKAQLVGHMTTCRSHDPAHHNHHQLFDLFAGWRIRVAAVDPGDHASSTQHGLQVPEPSCSCGPAPDTSSDPDRP